MTGAGGPSYRWRTGPGVAPPALRQVDKERRQQ